ncbi:Glycerophosphoryl diester phosphodiesterase [Paramagnetospirillum magnetotacticum MS-1]|uniref:Glycerophosphoryl diester phosphodiesterase n=1 Tax=Paramagnetospirillum magnetotacticum MS-1 TaxID=272627 RepID=A0A0C2YQI5_PARME|nr:glycerophosphodiester phosphodiesterase [Paramagnetospirillum magnetotacticum]KIL97378.1 Glycerophosphoryl diester phosphodiesterase [Paramagnetospirillum magnetotacticum MS-1]
MILIGHRGLAGLAPENTLASFRAAAAHGLTMVEFDVRLSKDGVPLVFHDDSLDRTTDGSGPVAEYGWAELSRLDAGSWFAPAFAGEPISSLEQVLRQCLDLGLSVNMEIKPDRGREAETALAALSLAVSVWPHAAPPPVISSFETVCLEVAHRIVPLWPRAILAEDRPGDWRQMAGQLEATALHLDHGALDAAQIAETMAAGLAVRAYTVNDPVRARLLQDWGVAAIFSDYPHSS